MNKISKIRAGVDGTLRNLTAIRDNLVSSVEMEIRDALNGKMRTLNARDIPVAIYIRDNLHDILMADVPRLKSWADYFDTKYPNRFRHRVVNHWRQTELGEAILTAFNFEKHRKKELVEVAKQLNVKTCPYCNMHYTLYANEPKKRSVVKLARFQFDHFFDKARYPMLSMSFYNLIPSCGVCNQGKSTGRLDLGYNPYYSDIHSRFHFELTNPLGLYSAMKVCDEVEVALVPEAFVDKDEFKKYANMFHLKSLYCRHGDVVQEVFDKAYEDAYYLNPENFNFLSDSAVNYLKRLWLGNYTEPQEIEKRPMAKFMQDMWRQAKGE